MYYRTFEFNVAGMATGNGNQIGGRIAEIVDDSANTITK
jgi:hypothetical protein